jgi:hypothetical protein
MRRLAACWLAVAGVWIAFAAGGCSPGSDRGAKAGEKAPEILAISDPFQRSIQWSALLGDAQPDTLPALRDAVAASPVDIGDPEVVAFAMWWAHFTPQDALAWTRTEWRAEPQSVIGAIFRVWGNGAPDAAFTAAEGIGEFYEQVAFDGVISGWHDSGKPGLVERVQSLTDDVKRQRITESLARRLVLGQGTEAALRWVETIQEPAFRQTMTMRITSTAATQGDAEKIAAWATPFVSSGPLGDVTGYPRRIGTRWILRDPPAALAWLKSLPEGRDRDDGVAESYRDWLSYAPGAALKWAQESPLEPWNEPAFAIYARALSNGNAKQALDLAMRFQNIDRRYLTVTVIARAWGTREEKAARDWLAQADLPPDVKQRAAIKLREPRKANQPGPAASPAP